MLTWERIMWQPGRTDCRFCSNIDKQVPAEYDVWFEARGPVVVTEEYAPASICFPLCAKCTAEERANTDKDDDMPLVRVKTIAP